MKSKPIVMSHLRLEHISFILDFEFTCNIMFVTGDSATGKTVAFSMIQEHAVVNSSIVCLDYRDCQKDIKRFISEQTGKLIVVDNADVLLDDDIRWNIACDGNNQYLIIGRNASNMLTTSDNIFVLDSEKIGKRTVFKLKKRFKR